MKKLVLPALILLAAFTLITGETLAEVGTTVGVATGTIDLGDVYMQLIQRAEKRQLESKTIKRYQEKFQIFLALAYFLLCIEGLIGERRKD